MRGFIIKEFYHIFRDVRTMIILFGMPVVQILLFGFALTNEIKDAGIAILDPSKDLVTKEITGKIIGIKLRLGLFGERFTVVKWLEKTEEPPGLAVALGDLRGFGEGLNSGSALGADSAFDGLGDGELATTAAAFAFVVDFHEV